MGLPTKFFGILAGLVLSAVVVLWWLFFSRAPWVERLGAIVLMVVALVATWLVVHESIASGMMGMMFFVYAIPVLSLAFVAWAVASRRLADGPRRASMAAAILLGVRSVDARPDRRHHGRRRLGVPLAVDEDSRGTAPGADRRRARRRCAAGTAAGPRGTARVPRPACSPRRRLRRPLRRLRQLRLLARSRAGTDASRRRAAAPPATPAMRRPKPTGPAFADPSATASFAACGSRPTGPRRRRSSCGAGRSDRAGRPSRSAATSSTRRSSAATTRSSPATALTTGEPVWRHRDAARFWESNAGAGPRGTPTLSNGRVYTFGATGILNALDAGDGAVVWSRNAASDTGAKSPGLGLRELAAGGRRPRHRRRRRHARRLRRRHRQAALVRARPAAAATARRIS